MRSLTVTAILLVGLTASVTAAAADMMRGQKIYMTHCVACHGPRGMSVAPNTPNFAKGEGLTQPDMMLLQTVKMGKKAQPPFFGILTDQDILDSLAYSRTVR